MKRISKSDLSQKGVKMSQVGAESEGGGGARSISQGGTLPPLISIRHIISELLPIIHGHLNGKDFVRSLYIDNTI